MMNSQSIEEEALELHPWRDGSRHCNTTVASQKNKSPTRIITSVLVQFSENDMRHVVADKELIALFEAIGSKLTEMKTLDVRLQASSDLSLSSKATPPLQALSGILREAQQLTSVSFTGLRFSGGVNDLDVRALSEALRIHPRLASFEMTECWFGETVHLENIKTAIRSIPSLKHSDLNGNVIVERFSPTKPLCASFFVEPEADVPDNRPHSFLSWCMYPLTCCSSPG